MSDDAILNSNSPTMFDIITTTIGILHQIPHFMTGFHSWVVIWDTCSTTFSSVVATSSSPVAFSSSLSVMACLIYSVFRHVSNNVGVHYLVLIFVQYLLHHRGDIRGDVGVICHLVYGGIGRNIFDAVTANIQCRKTRHIHNADNI